MGGLGCYKSTRREQRCQIEQVSSLGGICNNFVGHHLPNLVPSDYSPTGFDQQVSSVGIL